MAKVSVIIPVYNAEPYIERCVRSLFGQTLDDMEFIFVDDSSPDNSIGIIRQVLEYYPTRKNQVLFLENETNLGPAVTRTRGMKAATGEYLIHCDSDDWVEANMYECLYRTAISQHSDIVVCDYVNEYQGDRAEVRSMGPLPENPHEVLSCTDKRPFYSSWLNLVRTQIVQENGIYPIEGINMWEDLLIGMKEYYYAKSLSYVPKPLYHYNKCNDASYTSKPFTDAFLEQEKACVKNLEEFFQDKEIDFTNTALVLKKMIKDRYLCQVPPNYKKWKTCYPEAANVKLRFEKSNWIYDLAYQIGNLGIFTPLRFYYALTSLLR